jgi:hypothetical protein
MSFDPHAMRTEIAGQRPVSQVSRKSQPLYFQKPAFRVAVVAPPPAQ